MYGDKMPGNPKKKKRIASLGRTKKFSYVDILWFVGNGSKQIYGYVADGTGSAITAIIVSNLS